jgi:hypothetical protein
MAILKLMEKHMKFSKTILSTLVLASSASFASTYNAEVGVDYTDYEGDASLVTIHGTYHFTEVDTTNKPLAEAAFLQRRSFIAATHSELDVDGGGSADAQTIGAGFFIPNSIFFVAAHYLKAEDEDNTALTLGITPIDGLLVTTTHYTESDDYVANLSAKYVRQLAGETAINLEAEFVDGEDGADNAISLAADYYFTNFFSVGAVVQDEGESAYGIRTRYFFNDSFSLNGQFTTSDNLDTLLIGATFRF